MKRRYCFFLLFLSFASVYPVPTQSEELRLIDVFAPRAIDFSTASIFRAVYWGWDNQVVLADYFGERKIYLIDLTTGEVANEFPLSKSESIHRVDRKAKDIAIWSPEQTRYLTFGHDHVETDSSQSCMLSYEYHGAPKRKSTFSFVRATPEGQSRSTPRFISEIFPPGGLADPGPMNVVDCLRGGENVLLSAVYESQGSLYCAELNDLYLIRIRYLGLYGAQAFFVNDDRIISLKHNDEVETKESEPKIYYPVIVSKEGVVVFEDRSIRLIQAVRVFDYDPVTKSVVAFIQGSTRTSSIVAIFQVVE